VYLKLQPYVQKTVATRANQKLSFRYYGPYPVVQKVGGTAYKLDLPERAKVHPIVHVSQLKKALKPSVQVQKELPARMDDPCQPERVMERRSYVKGMKSANQVLIQWTGVEADLATWEDENELKTKFPAAPAWGQAVVKEGGDVRDLSTATTTGDRLQNAKTR
jgi:hypothetical protein